MNNETIEYGFGAEFSAPDLRDYKINKNSLLTEFPKEFELSNMPDIKCQGVINSCTAMAVTTVAEYYSIKQHDIQELSAGFVYGNRVPPLHEKSGMNLKHTIAQFCKDGAPLQESFPFHYEVPAIITAVKNKKEKLAEEAKNFAFSTYVTVPTEQEIKTALMYGAPVIISIYWPWDVKVNKGVIHSSRLNDTKTGHCLVIYGWDERGWKVQNSWGKVWGDNGRAIWPYDYPIRNAYAIFDTENTPIDIKKPHKSKTKFGKWLVKLGNKIYSFFYWFVCIIKRR